MRVATLVSSAVIHDITSHRRVQIAIINHKMMNEFFVRFVYKDVEMGEMHVDWYFGQLNKLAEIKRPLFFDNRLNQTRNLGQLKF